MNSFSHSLILDVSKGGRMDEFNVLDKAFQNAFYILAQNSSQKEIPTVFESQIMRLHFIEIYKQLYKKSSGNQLFMTHWFNVVNKIFDSTPAEMCKTEDGLLIVLDYLVQESATM